jgi:hypothetical protein
MEGCGLRILVLSMMIMMMMMMQFDGPQTAIPMCFLIWKHNYAQ